MSTMINWEITGINQRLVKQQGPAPGKTSSFVIWEVSAVAVADNLPLDQQQTVNGQHNSRWPVAPPFSVGDVVQTPWPAAPSPAG